MTGPLSPVFTDKVTRLETAPPPISGGTLLLAADGATLVAADPDRDAVYVFDAKRIALVRRIALQTSDEPGRVVQDAKGRIHVALRSGGAIASFSLADNTEVRRTPVCSQPRGLAYAAETDRLYVACVDGTLVELDPNAGTITKTFHLARDLRDVIVRGGRLLITRFRSAQLLEVDPSDGRVLATRAPPDTKRLDTTVVERLDHVPRDAVRGSTGPSRRGHLLLAVE